jgi:hypothetical protein
LRTSRSQRVRSSHAKAFCTRNLRQEIAGVGVVVNDKGVRHNALYFDISCGH